MIPQSTPLYAVGEANTHIDLLLVVAWSPINDGAALPVFLDLHSTSDTARTMSGEHSRVTFYDDRELAEIAHETLTAQARQRLRRTAANPGEPSDDHTGRLPAAVRKEDRATMSNPKYAARARKAAAARWGNSEAADEATRQLLELKLDELLRQADDLRKQKAGGTR